MQSLEPNLIILLSLVTLIAPLAAGIYSPSMPDLVVYFETDVAAIQATFTAYLVGMSLGNIVFGILSDKFGRRNILIWGLVGSALFCVLCSLSTSIFMLFVARFSLAFCMGATIATLAIVRDRYEGIELVRFLSYLSIITAVGPALGPVIGGYLQDLYGWKSNFYFLAFMVLLCLMSCIQFLPETLTNHSRQAYGSSNLMSNLETLVRSKEFVGYSLNGSFAFGAVMAYSAASPFIFIDILGTSAAEYGLYVIWPVLFMALGNFMAGRMVKQFGLSHSTIIGSIILLVGSLLFTLLALLNHVSISSVLISLCLTVMGVGICLPCSMSGSQEPFPKMAGTAASFSSFFRMLAGALSSIALGLTYDGTPHPMGSAMTVFAFFALCSCFIINSDSKFKVSLL